MTNLCLYCRHSRVTVGHSFSHQRIFCEKNGVFPTELHWPVQKCTYYVDDRFRAPEDMKAIAWTVRVNKNRSVGFTPPQSKEE